jgi:hypothetical protein
MVSVHLLVLPSYSANTIVQDDEHEQLGQENEPIVVRADEGTIKLPLHVHVLLMGASISVISRGRRPERSKRCHGQ